MAGDLHHLVMLRGDLGREVRRVWPQLVQENRLGGVMPGRKLRRFEEYLAVVRVGANRGRQCVQAGLDRAVLAQQPLSQWSRSVTNSVTASRARW
jgi:hypothetical protein